MAKTHFAVPHHLEQAGASRVVCFYSNTSPYCVTTPVQRRRNRAHRRTTP